MKSFYGRFVKILNFSIFDQMRERLNRILSKNDIVKWGLNCEVNKLLKNKQFFFIFGYFVVS